MASMSEELTALGLVADLRKALGDPTGKLMQDELVAHAARIVAERDRLRAQVEDMRTAVHSCHPGCSNARCVAERLRADVRELVELAAETVNEWDLRIVDGDDYAACKRVIENTMAPLRALLAKRHPPQALADCTEEFPHRAPYRVAHLAPVLPPNALAQSGAACGASTAAQG